MPEEVVASLKPGENLIAGYCRNRVGNGLLDFGLLVEWTVPFFPSNSTTNICRRHLCRLIIHLLVVR